LEGLNEWIWVEVWRSCSVIEEGLAVFGVEEVGAVEEVGYGEREEVDRIASLGYDIIEKGRGRLKGKVEGKSELNMERSSFVNYRYEEIIKLECGVPAWSVVTQLHLIDHICFLPCRHRPFTCHDTHCSHDDPPNPIPCSLPLDSSPKNMLKINPFMLKRRNRSMLFSLPRWSIPLQTEIRSRSRRSR
jgi:hypothetical protein